MNKKTTKSLMGTTLAGVISIVMLALTSPAHAIPGLFTTTLSGNTTGYSDSIFTGAPDDTFLGIGGQIVTFDFGSNLIIDGAGNDFNVYEVDYGGVEFHRIHVSVSLDGSTFYNVDATQAAWVDIDGDEAHGNAAFARSYGLHLIPISTARYVRIDGVGTSAPNGCCNLFDLDAIGAINFATAVPAPGTLALFGLGLAGLGFARRKNPA